MPTLATIVLGAVAVYGLVALLAWAFQKHLVFFPTTGAYETTPADIGLSWRDLTLTAADGTRISAWFIPVAEPAAPVVLFLHGNAGDMSHRLGRVAALHELGMTTLMIDYRGFGTSEGEPDEAGLYRDAQAAWDWLTGEAGYPPGQIVPFGRSLGTALAARLAAEHDPAALVLESPFTSLPNLAAHHYPWLPARQLARYRFDTAAALAATHCPVLIAHSPDDEIVPHDHADALARVRPAATRRVRLAGGHNAPTLSADVRWRSALQAFVTAHAVAEPGQ